MSNLILKLKQRYLDKANLYQSVVDLPKQCTDAFKQTKNLAFPSHYLKVNKIIVAGMGGSALAARAIESIYSQTLKKPLFILNGYQLPGWVDKQTLIICSSYSGTTEEVLCVCQQSIKQKLPWMAIANGKDLLNLANKHQVPVYCINDRYNPSHQPRMAIGYSLVGLLAIFHQLKLINFSETDLSKAVKVMKTVISHNHIGISRRHNPSLKLAEKIQEKQVVFVAAEHLTGSLHTFKNQLNENAKHLAHRHDVPELNHHLMEGLSFPLSNQEDVIFLLFQSLLYQPSNQKRIMLTQEIIKKNQIETLLYQARSETLLTQAFEVIQLGGFVSYYLALKHSLNPAKIPWVDYFKSQLR